MCPQSRCFTNLHREKAERGQKIEWKLDYYSLSKIILVPGTIHTRMHTYVWDHTHICADSLQPPLYYLLDRQLLIFHLYR